MLKNLSLKSRLGLGFFLVRLLFLAAIGIYGVLAYQVTNRRREIGIRVALGSTAGGIVRMVLREGLLLAAFGLVLGTVGSIALRQVIENEIYGVGALNPLVMVGVAVLLALVTLSASVFPARRASRVDPVRAVNQS